MDKESLVFSLKDPYLFQLLTPERKAFQQTLLQIANCLSTIFKTENDGASLEAETEILRDFLQEKFLLETYSTEAQTLIKSLVSLTKRVDLKTQNLKSVEDTEKFALRLREARRLRNLTQEQTADILLVERAYYCRIEKGRRLPSMAFVKRAKTFFNLADVAK